MFNFILEMEKILERDGKSAKRHRRRHSPNKYKSGQKHSRSYTSQFLVFIKDPKKKSKDFFFEDMLNRCEREEAENYANVIEK